MTASFDGQDFGERGTGDHFPVTDAKAIATQQRPPGGDVLVVQKLADRVQLLSTTARTDYAGYTALVGKVGIQGTLVLGAMSGVGWLLEVGKAGEIGASGIFFCDLTFLLVSAGYGGGVTGYPYGTGPYGGGGSTYGGSA